MASREVVKQLRKLSKREREILQLRCQALGIAECCKQLHLSGSTVKTYIGRIYLKFDLDQYSELQRWRELFQIYCPVLKEIDLPPGTDPSGGPEPVPEQIIRRVEDDEELLYALGGQRLERLTKSIPPAVSIPPKRLRWLIVGLFLGVLLFAAGILLVSKVAPAAIPAAIIVIATPIPNFSTDTPLLQAGGVTQQAQPAQSAQIVTVVPPTYTPYPTNTPYPTYTPFPEPTQAPTAIPVVIVATPTFPPPTATPQTTPPGTILEIGQTWRQGGAELTLKDVKILSDHVEVFFEFTNHKPKEISVRFKAVGNLSATDNRNRELQTCYNGACDFDRDYIISSGDTVQITSARPDWPPLVRVDTTDPKLTEIIVKVVDFSSINGAQWRIPINH